MISDRSNSTPVKSYVPLLCPRSMVAAAVRSAAAQTLFWKGYSAETPLGQHTSLPLPAEDTASAARLP